VALRWCPIYEAGDGRQQKKGKLRHGAAAPKKNLVPKNELKNNQTENVVAANFLKVGLQPMLRSIIYPSTTAHEAMRTQSSR